MPMIKTITSERLDKVSTISACGWTIPENSRISRRAACTIARIIASGFLYFTARQRIMTATANSTMNKAVQSHGIAACTTVIPLLHADTARKTDAPINITEATVTMMLLIMSGLNSARRAAAAIGTSRSRIIVISSGEYICITEL